jgi:hypothetical protein
MLPIIDWILSLFREKRQDSTLIIPSLKEEGISWRDVSGMAYIGTTDSVGYYKDSENGNYRVGWESTWDVPSVVIIENIATHSMVRKIAVKRMDQGVVANNGAVVFLHLPLANSSVGSTVQIYNAQGVEVWKRNYRTATMTSIGIDPDGNRAVICAGYQSGESKLLMVDIQGNALAWEKSTSGSAPCKFDFSEPSVIRLKAMDGRIIRHNIETGKELK